MTPSAADSIPTGSMPQHGDAQELLAEHERLARELRESERRLRTVVSTAPVIIYSFDRDGTITFIDGKGLEILGFSAGELVGRSLFDLARHRHEVIDHMRRTIAGEECTFRLAAGGRILECRATPSFDAGGSVSTVIGVATDVTHLVRAEKERSDLVRQVDAERRRLDSLIESLPGAIWEAGLCDGVLRMTFVSDYIEQLLGFTSAEFLSQPDFWLSRVHPDDREIASVPEDLIALENESSRSYRMITRGGHTIWVEVRFSVVRDEKREPIGLRGFVVDVTERKSAGERLSAISDLNRSIIESVKAHIAVIEPDGRISMANESWMSFARDFGAEYSSDWGPGGNYLNVIRESISLRRTGAEDILNGVTGVLERRLEFFSGEYNVETSSGRRIVQISISPMQGSGGAVVVRQDVTDQRMAERAQLASQQLFESFMDHSPALAFIKDASGRYVYVNEPLARNVGHTRRSIVGCSDTEVWPRAIAEQFARHDREVLQSQLPTFFEERVILSGTERTFHAIRFPMRDAAGNNLVCGEAHDVTDQRQMLESLRTSEERFRLTAQATSDIVYDWDILEQSIWWNENLEKRLGHIDNGKLDLAWWESQVHPDDFGPTTRSLYSAIENGAHHWTGDYRFRRADGSYANLYERGYILFDAAGVAVRMIGAISDRTEHKQAEEALRRSEERYRRIVETAQEGIWVTDEHGVTTFVNATMARMIGWPPAEMIGHKFEEYLDTISLESARGNQERRRQGKSDRYDLRLVTKGGESIWALVSASPILDEEGQLVGSLAMVTDITSRKEVETALRSARDELELRVGERTAELAAAMGRLQQANLAQRRFVADASHDLRTPLTVVRAELDLLLRAGVPDNRTRASLERALSEARRLDHLATDMLTLATLDALNAEDRLELIRLDELLLESISSFMSLARQRQIVWTITIDDAIEIRGSRLGLERAIANILDNALKYSADGSTVGVTLRREDSEAVLVVEDSGIGIPEEDLAKVFERFYRSDVARSTPGTGLGLSIVRSVVESHGGTIEIRSNPGCGTTVTTRLPMP